MWVLLIASIMVAVGIIGYYIFKLDRFLEKDGFKKAKAENSPVAIVLGSSELTKEITGLLHQNTVEIFHITEPFLLEQGGSFRYLFALSEKDADNIVICKIGRRVYNIEQMISICNDRMNESMFINEGIRYMYGTQITAQKLYQSVMEEPGVSS